MPVRSTRSAWTCACVRFARACGGILRNHQSFGMVAICIGVRYLICSGLSEGNWGYLSERTQSASDRSDRCLAVRAAFCAAERLLKAASLSIAI